jgi:hypothetical protein
MIAKVVSCDLASSKCDALKFVGVLKVTDSRNWVLSFYRNIHGELLISNLGYWRVSQELQLP